MRNLSYKWAFAASLVMAVAVAFFITRAYISISQTVPTAVAAQDIQPGQSLSMSSVKICEMPRIMPENQNIKSYPQLHNMVSKGFVPAGTIMTKNMLISKSESGVNAELANNRVAFALDADLHTTCAGEIQQGSSVAVILAKNGTAVTLPDHAKVLMVKDKGVVLEVTPEAAVFIAAQRAGGSDVSLALMRSTFKENGS